jgi:hypothetical protein
MEHRDINSVMLAHSLVRMLKCKPANDVFDSGIFAARL